MIPYYFIFDIFFFTNGRRAMSYWLFWREVESLS